MDSLSIAVLNDELYIIGGEGGVGGVARPTLVEEYTPLGYSGNPPSTLTANPSGTIQPSLALSSSPTPTLSPIPTRSPTVTPSPTIPEFPSWIILPLLVAVGLLVYFVKRRRQL
jgi:hypothetical protein